jgi:hypothetical protein
MLRTLLLAIAAVLLVTPQASAVLVYERPPADASARNGAIVVSRDDGSHPRVVAHGHNPVVSPTGQDVGYFVAHGRDSLRVVPSEGGRSRRLLRSADGGNEAVPFAWSPDGRRIIAAADSTKPVLIDVRHARATRIPWGLPFFSASFSPDGKRAAISGEGKSADVVQRVDLRTHRRRRIAAVAYYGPLWGRGGIALAELHGGRGEEPTRYDTVLVRRPGEHARLLLGNSTPTAWAAGGRRLLAASPNGTALNAVLVTIATRATVSFPQAFTAVSGLSRDSELVLGEIGGDVVAARADGSVETLAAGATLPSWTR